MVSTQSVTVWCGHQATRIVLFVNNRPVKAGWADFASTLPVNSAGRTEEQHPLSLLCNSYIKHSVLHTSQHSQKQTFAWKFHIGHSKHIGSLYKRLHISHGWAAAVCVFLTCESVCFGLRETEPRFIWFRCAVQEDYGVHLWWAPGVLWKCWISVLFLNEAL